MDASITIINQIIKMFIIICVGYVLYKKDILNDVASEKLSSILLFVATPATLLTSFNQPFSVNKFYGFIISFCLSVTIYIISILIAHLIYKIEQGIEKFSLVFSNAGFIGIPLVNALLGIEAIFYLSPFIVCFYLFVWTYGVFIISNDKSNISIKKLKKNPCIWAVILGVIIFLLPAKPAAPIMESIALLGNLNTPLAMLVLGCYLAKCNIIEMFTNIHIYAVSMGRLIVIPVIVAVLFKFIPNSYQLIKRTIFIAASAPVGSLLPVFCQMYGINTDRGVQIVCLSTLLCSISIPLLLLLTNVIW